MDEAFQGLQLQSLITADGKLRISLEPVTLEQPGPGELVVRIEASPINPSDLATLFGPSDISTLRNEGSGDRPVLVAEVPEKRLGSVKARLDQPLPIGNEGAGTVVAAGPDLQHLLGRTVGMLGGAMYAQYRKLPVTDCIVLPEGARADEAASLFVNPLTALGFVETMHAEGHSAIVHTAAASNLGQMLVRICLADGVPLVNIVRSEEQAKILRDIGAVHVVDSSAPDFQDRLIDAIAATGATLAFDAIGGGTLGGQILAAMEAVANRTLGSYNRYGSNVLKQVYIYGSLDTGPTIINRSFGFAWRMGGWLLSPFLQQAGPETAAGMRQRVAEEFRTTFASHYTATVGLRDMLKPEVAVAYERRATGAKYLVNPNL